MSIAWVFSKVQLKDVIQSMFQQQGIVNGGQTNARGFVPAWRPTTHLRAIHDVISDQIECLQLERTTQMIKIEDNQDLRNLIMIMIL